MEWLWIIIPLLLLLAVTAALRNRPVGLWFEARHGGIPITMALLAKIKDEGKNPGHLVIPLLQAKKADIDIDPDEAHALLVEGGDLAATVQALLFAKRLDVSYPFRELARLGLEGSDMKLEVRRKALIGKIGRASSDLSPYGKGTFRGELYELRARDGFVPQGKKIVIEDVDRDHIWVREVEEGPTKGKGGWKKI